MQFLNNMKTIQITTEIEKLAAECADIILRGLEWAGSDDYNSGDDKFEHNGVEDGSNVDSAYREGVIDGVLFVVACKLVQGIFVPAGFDTGVGVCDLAEELDIYNKREKRTKARLTHDILKFIEGELE